MERGEAMSHEEMNRLDAEVNRRYEEELLRQARNDMEMVKRVRALGGAATGGPESAS